MTHELLIAEEGSFGIGERALACESEGLSSVPDYDTLAT